MSIEKLGGSGNEDKSKQRDDNVIRNRFGNSPNVDNDPCSKEEQGNRLKEARLKLYDTAEEAAKILGVSAPTYIAHENGGRQIRPDMATFYANRFGTTLNWILYGKDNPDPADPVEPEPTDPKPPGHPGAAALSRPVPDKLPDAVGHFVPKKEVA